MSKIIYQPKGKAGEYAKYAANFYNGCSGCCTYCYNRTGITAKVLGGDKPELKESLINKPNAMRIFVDEMREKAAELEKHGLFFNFVSDPCLKETYDLNFAAWWISIGEGVPVIVLTKQTWWVDDFINSLEEFPRLYNRKHMFAFGFTLTGHDELEPGCATNEDRIRAMKVLHDEGFKTWASIEPIIDLDASRRMIEAVCNHCDLMKIGLQSGAKYNNEHLRFFMQRVYILADTYQFHYYFKDSILKAVGQNRYPLAEFEVDSDYNLFPE